MRKGAVILLGLLVSCGTAREAGPAGAWHEEQVLRNLSEDGDSARMVPADAWWYVTVDRPASWLDDAERDPLIAHLWSIVESFYPPDLWKRGAENLGLTHSQMLHRYFGRRVAVADHKLEDDRLVVVMSRAEERDLQALPGALGLAAYEAQREVGPFRIYSLTQDDKPYVFAIGAKWLCITQTEKPEELFRCLTAVASGRPAIGSERQYEPLLGRLPRGADAVMLTRSEDGKERHAMTIERRGQEIVIEYAARSPGIKELTEDVERVEGVDFGAIPSNAITAVTFNLMRQEIEGAQAMNVLLFPRNFNKHVRPYIAPPVVAYLGQLPPIRVEGGADLPVPVLGVAVQITDPRVTQDLDRILKGVHFLLSVSRLDLAQGFMGVRQVKRDGLEYHVADLGPTVQKMVGDDESDLAKMIRLPSDAGLTRIAFGRIGRQYVVCTQEAFFLRWSEAMADPGARLMRSEDFASFRFDAKPSLIASGLVRADLLGELLRQVADYWEQAQAALESRPARTVSQEERKRREREEAERVRRPMRWVADGLRHRQSFSIQLWSDESAEDITRGRLSMTPKPPAKQAAGR